jgi:hypothetical protein
MLKSDRLGGLDQACRLRFALTDSAIESSQMRARFSATP